MIESGALARLPGIAHGFFTREGGVSTGIYDSLNCGYGAGDAAENVHENRRRVMAALGAGRLVTLHQIHSAQAVTVTEPWAPGDGPRADAMVTNRSGPALGILTADCAPILLADAGAGVVGAVHGGWKGLLAGIIEAATDAMTDLGARADAVTAAVGPALAADSYEVGPEFRERFVSADPAFARFFETGERGHFFDLPGFARDRLENAGIAEIDVLNIDTYTDESRFFSYRRAHHRGDSDYGRQISAIMLRPS